MSRNNGMMKLRSGRTWGTKPTTSRWLKSQGINVLKVLRKRIIVVMLQKIMPPEKIKQSFGLPFYCAIRSQEISNTPQNLKQNTGDTPLPGDNFVWNSFVGVLFAVMDKLRNQTFSSRRMRVTAPRCSTKRWGHPPILFEGE